MGRVEIATKWNVKAINLTVTVTVIIVEIATKWNVKYGQYKKS